MGKKDRGMCVADYGRQSCSVQYSISIMIASIPSTTSFIFLFIKSVIKAFIKFIHDDHPVHSLEQRKYSLVGIINGCGSGARVREFRQCRRGVAARHTATGLEGERWKGEVVRSDMCGCSYQHKFPFCFRHTITEHCLFGEFKSKDNCKGTEMEEEKRW